MNELTILEIAKHGPLLGVKNAASVVGAVMLWALTVWVPYVNVGTTIGLLGLVAAMSRGETVSPLEIFDAGYRKKMGEFFLVVGFMTFGIYAGFLFLVIPGLAIATAWTLAPLLVLDQKMDPIAAIHRSNELTSGKRLTIFFGRLLPLIAIELVLGVLGAVAAKIHPILGALVFFAGAVVLLCSMMGINAYIYAALTHVPKPRAAAMPKRAQVTRDDEDEVTRPNPPTPKPGVTRAMRSR